MGENAVAKGCIIANVEMTNPDQHAGYRALSDTQGIFRARTVVIEFPSSDAAKTFYHSAEYEIARNERAYAAQMNLMVVEGV
jgi:uncharacterized protein (DUF1330 family)